jgi:ABC-type branched-subunit amino acid transport system ATPase component
MCKDEVTQTRRMYTTKHVDKNRRITTRGKEKQITEEAKNIYRLYPQIRATEIKEVARAMY